MFNLQLQFDRIDDFNTKTLIYLSFRKYVKMSNFFFSLVENAITFIRSWTCNILQLAVMHSNPSVVRFFHTQIYGFSIKIILF